MPTTQDDMARIMRRVHDLPDRELVRMVDLKAAQYRPGALSIAEEEIEARGGLAHLREQAAPSHPTTAPRDEAADDEPAWHARLGSALIGRSPSEKYPALGYVAIGLRLLSFLFAAFAVVLFSSNNLSLITDIRLPGLFPLMGFYPSLLFLVFFGASELIHVFTDMVADTRASRELLRTLIEQERRGDDAR